MQSSVYNPFFTPMRYSPALWLDASDRGTLIMDGARSFTSTSNHFFNCASNSGLQAGDVDWFWCLWAKPSSLTGSHILGKYTNGTNNDYVIELLNVTGLVITYIYSSGGTVSATSNVGLSTSVWKMIFVYYSKTDKKVYISIDNGNFVASSAHTGTAYSSTADLMVGKYYTLSSSYYPGLLDSLVYGKPTTDWLTSNATALRDYLYNGGSGRRSSDFLASAYYTGGNPSGAVSWWDMDARSGNETDRIGSNNLTDNGGVGYAAGVASGLVQYTGDPIKQWLDKSGNARHVTAASDAGRPTYTTGVQNGLPGVTMDGLNDYLSVTGISVTNNGTLYLVCDVKTATSGNPIFAAGSSDTNNGWLLTYANWNYSRNRNITLAPFIATGVQVLSAWADDTEWMWYMNGTYQNGKAGASASSNMDRFVLSGRSAGTGGGNQVWFEVLYYPEKHTDNQRSNVTRYLGNKWGITVP